VHYFTGGEKQYNFKKASLSSALSITNSMYVGWLPYEPRFIWWAVLTGFSNVSNLGSKSCI
jgi:hypothetical protein